MTSPRYQRAEAWSIGRECYERCAAGDDQGLIRRDVQGYATNYRLRHSLPGLRELGVRMVRHDKEGRRLTLTHTDTLFPWEEW